MRRLIYIPIIHTDSDMGSLASALEQDAVALCGEPRWARHKATATEFWQRVADYLETLAAKSLKIYQDGFVSDGNLDRKIIAEGVKRGSKNYEIILNLLNKGAKIVPTEDVALLEAEYRHLSRIMQAETSFQKNLARGEYEARKAQLSQERDRFIARTINLTLECDEVGLLFIGADHNVMPYLAEDIKVEQLKEPKKVRAYFNELIYGNDERNFRRLASYLTSAVMS